jgi:putative ABC transport system permease protein
MKLLPFEYAVRNLGRSPSRLALSVIGSALVVLLVLAAAAFVRGMDASIGESGAADNVIILGTGSEESVERSEMEASVPSVLEATLSGIRTRADVAFVSPEVHVMLTVRTSDQASDRQAMIRGVTPAALLVHEQVRLIEGRLPAPGADELIAGRTAGTVIGASDAAVAAGSTIRIEGREWRIVGRFAAPGTVMEGELWTSLPDIMAATKRKTISCVVLTLDPAEAEFADVAAFTKMRPDLELSAMPERDYYGQLAAFFGPIRFVAWVTAGLIALGGLCGGLNTMYAAFASRVRELGTLQSLGYRRKAIVVSLVQESLLATASGSLIACAAAAAFFDGLTVRFSMGAFGLVVDSSVMATGLIAGLTLGLCGALPPAIRCLRLSIPTALKSF